MRFSGIAIVALVVLGAISSSTVAHAEMAEVPAGLIALDTPEGEKLLVESNARRDYFSVERCVRHAKGAVALSDHASAVMVLNALNIAAPATRRIGRPYRTFTQDNVYNDRARALGVARGGLQLEQLKAFLETYPVEATAVHAGDDSLENFSRKRWRRTSPIPTASSSREFPCARGSTRRS